jgi:hypothetical protein
MIFSQVAFRQPLNPPITLRSKSLMTFLLGGNGSKQLNKFTTTNPATGETLSKVGLAGKKEVNQAVRAARKAYDNVWSKMPAAERGQVSLPNCQAYSGTSEGVRGGRIYGWWEANPRKP